MRSFARLASPSGFALVLLLFLFLPFLSVSCEAGSIDYSGASLAANSRPAAEVAPGLEDVATQLTSAIGTDQTPAGGVQVLAIIVGLLLVVGIVLPFLPQLAHQLRYRMFGSAAVAVLTGVFLVVTQQVAQSSISADLADIARDVPGTGSTPNADDIADRFVHSGVGFWLALVVLFVVALISVGYVYKDKLFPKPAVAMANVSSAQPIWRAESPEPTETPPPTGPSAPTEPPAPVGPAAPSEPPAPAGPEAPSEPPAPTDPN